MVVQSHFSTEKGNLFDGPTDLKSDLQLLGPPDIPGSSKWIGSMGSFTYLSIGFLSGFISYNPLILTFLGHPSGKTLARVVYKLGLLIIFTNMDDPPSTTYNL